MNARAHCFPSQRFLSAAIAFSIALIALPAMGGAAEKAKRIHDRLTGVPPSASVLASMQTLLGSDPIAAANLAMDNPAFYNATLKNWATPWTNREGNKFAPLNDYTATVIGLVRDRDDYRKVLYDNVLYVPDAGTYGAYSSSNNNAYVALENSGADMGNVTILRKTTQSSVPGAATAGVITTRAAARAFFVDGTNRAMFRFTLKNHLCHDMEQVQDTTRPSDRIRQDVPRSPGGDSRLFMNGCVGCHSGMDPMAQAFAYYDFNYDKTATDQDAARDAGQIQYAQGVVQSKYFINSNHFVEGYITPDDHWDNYWRSGPNTAIFGWSNTHVAATGAARTVNGIYGDAGAKALGEELANSEAFAVCSVKKVFQTVCLRDPASADQTAFATMVGNLKSNNYDLKHTFAEAAVYCSGN
jgi:hypothetical protein